MANTYHKLYVQAVFAVKYREAVLASEWRQEIFGVIGNLINDTGCKTIIVNGIEDHVHCFFGLIPSVPVSTVMKVAKAKSSKHINVNNLTRQQFHWQDGYGSFSYSHSQIADVYQYIARQDEHHKNQAFRDEYVALLESFEIPFEERHIFHDLI